MPATADQAAQEQLRWGSGNAQLVRHELPGLLWHTVASGDLQGLGAAAELAAPSQTLMTAGALMLLDGGLLAPDRRLAASSAATIAAQATYVLMGFAVAGGTGLIREALVHSPAFAAARLQVLGRVAAGSRGARTWVHTTRPDADGDRPDAAR